MVEQALERIKHRRSVRSFSDEPLRGETLSALRESLAAARSPYGIPVEFRILDAAEHGLASPVLVGANTYAAGKLRLVPHAEEAFGFAFERFVLDADAMGVGTVWIGGTMKRELFEKAAGLKDGRMMPCVSPLGYPAKKSLKEVMMRKGVGADSRIPADRLFFDGAWDRPLIPAADVCDALEAVRLAPSAVNKQPWRIIFKDGAYHFYEKKDRGYDRENTGDLQKIDVGIALCHFMMSLEDAGRTCEVCVSDPGIAIPADVEYIASVKF